MKNIFWFFALGPISFHGSLEALRELTLYCKQQPLICEVAESASERSQGLMHRLSLEEGRGMLFIFDRPQPLAFWMKNTLIPLSVAYLDGKGVIQEFHELYPLSEVAATSQSRSLLFAIEVPQGWWKKIGAQIGDPVLGLSVTK